MTLTFIHSQTGGFNLKYIAAYKYREKKDYGGIKADSCLSIYLKNGDGELEAIYFNDVEADNLFETIKEFKHLINE